MVNAVVQTAAFLFTFAGAACLYLGAPRQQWRSRPLPCLPSRIGGAGLLLLGWLSWLSAMHAAAASFTTLTAVMALFVAFPGLGALAALLRKK